ncbi:MAG TPA: hypothetical protein VFO60_01985, partial [Candidatus Dormibacteraeota bacterium]|nr:hypothetical protein [Candidatus Dormibacteraeota bacterium]
GAAAVGALCRPWHPAPRLLEPGLAAMTEAHDGASRRMNRVVSHDGRTELALGRDGLWYLLRRERRSAPLVAAAPGSTDPRILLAPVEEAGPPLPAPAPPGDVPRLAGEQLRLL